MNVDSDDILFLRHAGRQRERIHLDSVFGFIRKGVQYLYLARERRYMAVLNDKPPVMLVVKEDADLGAV